MKSQKVIDEINKRIETVKANCEGHWVEVAQRDAIIRELENIKEIVKEVESEKCANCKHFTSFPETLETANFGYCHNPDSPQLGTVVGTGLRIDICESFEREE